MNTNNNLLDQLGYAQKEQEIAYMLSEILKLLAQKEQEFVADITTAYDPTQLAKIVAHVDHFKPGKEVAFHKINEFAQHLRIAANSEIPAGFIMKLGASQIKYEHMLLQFITAYRKKEQNILHDLGLKISKANSNEKKVEEVIL